MASQDSNHHDLLQWHFTHDLNHSSFHIYGRRLTLLLIFFSIIILTILFLYVHSVCFARRVASVAAETGASSSAASRPTSQSSGLDAATIGSLPIFLHRSLGGSGSEQSECSICLGDFQEEEKVKVLPECQHAYHSECVDKWLSEQSSCPLCRASLIRVDSPV